MTEWLTDNRGNKCSVEYWGSREEAQKALDSLEDCDNCINCSDCLRCSRCSDCSDCLDCSRCSYCSRCSGCSDSHCRAGWAVHLAGDAGYALEKFHGSLLAAQLIYRESGSPISPVRFFDSNDEALADMKRAAEAEAARG